VGQNIAFSLTSAPQYRQYIRVPPYSHFFSKIYLRFSPKSYLTLYFEKGWISAPGPDSGLSNAEMI
jgi:hypothetical protein